MEGQIKWKKRNLQVFCKGHVHTHTHTPSRIDPCAHFQSKRCSRIGPRRREFISCFNTWTTSFSSPALFPIVDKREMATKPITHLSSLQPGRSCWRSPSFSPCHLFSECVCATSCLLNITGISAGGLIKKQLPLVVVGDAWRRVARLIWWMVWGNLACNTHTHTHRNSHRNCL